MLTYNLDTTDGLTNGTFGEVLGFETLDNGAVNKIIIHLYDKSIAAEHKKQYPELQKQYPGKNVLPIKRYECAYNIGNQNEISASKANAFICSNCT